MHLADVLSKSTSVHSGYTSFVSMCVPWELNPQPFVLLTQSSTTEPLKHTVIFAAMHCDVDIHLTSRDFQRNGSSYALGIPTSFRLTQLLPHVKPELAKSSRQVP